MILVAEVIMGLCLLGLLFFIWWHWQWRHERGGTLSFLGLTGMVSGLFLLIGSAVGFGHHWPLSSEVTVALVQSGGGLFLCSFILYQVGIHRLPEHLRNYHFGDP